MFFDDWSQLGRAALIAALAYVALVAAVRVAGSRAITKMSAHDLIVTVALGSLLATIPLQQSVSLAQGAVIVAMFLAMQRMFKWANVRWPAAGSLIKGDPILVAYEGRMLDRRMASVHLSDADVRSAVRSAGLASLDQALAIVLEIDGSLSVIPRQEARDRSALEGLHVPADERG